MILQEVHNESGVVETELAARDSGRLKRILEIESIRVNTENMEAILRERHKVDEEGAPEPACASPGIEQLLLEQVLFLLHRGCVVVTSFMQSRFAHASSSMHQQHPTNFNFFFSLPVSHLSACMFLFLAI